MNCDLCGKEEELLRAVVEGTDVTVCRPCSRYGKVTGKVKPLVIAKKAEIKRAEKELLEIIVPDYAVIIKKSREKKGLKQEEMAKAISEKESLLHHVETGKYEPNIDLARKLEKFLKIKLVEQHEEVQDKRELKKNGEFTLGDFVKVKKR